MTFESFYKELDAINALRTNRMRMAKMVLNDYSLYDHLFKIAFQVDDPVSSKACWVLEFVYLDEPEFIIPYLDRFTADLKNLKLDSSIRPLAKISQLMVEAYFKKKTSKIQSALTDQHLELITEACFDWLIQDEKVAAKVYSMYSLFHLGKKYDWIHDELRLVIQKDVSNESAGYKAATRKVLEWIRS
ncbi:adenylosuccinate lyase [Spongiivirga citrea]|uniref:Adenylosuccinate lyase n=1 Tax=Spongiivirga citrea TaxID=1481457 RepID=A0A6M0CJC4_9FLAO|nr:adenylosuccinate lyase [Spongiivirga citrea]NER17941.1 adenylosuccinate lyase [Spongiivirga citrea]